MIQLTGLIGKQLFELDPSLNVREVEEFLITDHALWLQGYEPHSMTYKDKLLRLHCTLSKLIVGYELPKMLFGKLNCLRGLVVAYELHHQLQLEVEFKLTTGVLQLRFISVAPVERRINGLTPERVELDFLRIIQVVVTVLALFLDYVIQLLDDLISLYEYVQIAECLDVRLFPKSLRCVKHVVVQEIVKNDSVKPRLKVTL